MDFLVYLFIRIFILLFSIVPYRILYILSDAVAFILCYVIRYRREVVDSNLRRCNLVVNRRDIYCNLTDILFESFKTPTISHEEIARRYIPIDVDICNNYLRMGQSIVVAGGHLGNWEWAVLRYPMVSEGKAYGIYKPLSNKYVEKYFSRIRSSTGMNLVPIKGAFDLMLDESINGTFILMADQNPSNSERAHWVEFFGYETACLPGVGLISNKRSLPVVYFEISRVKRGYYKFRFKEIIPAESILTEEQRTAVFMVEIEKSIRNRSSEWLWTHKRWKHTRKINV